MGNSDWDPSEFYKQHLSCNSVSFGSQDGSPDRLFLTPPAGTAEAVIDRHILVNKLRACFALP